MDAATTTLQRRQIWAKPMPTHAHIPHTCSPYALPSGAVINVDRANVLTLTANAVLQPPCPGVTLPSSLDPTVTGTDFAVFEKSDPFYTSTSPLIYAISGVTIVSFMLVIILIATPRTFYIAGPGGGVSLLGRKSNLGGASGSNTIIGVGSRPWLQKIAAITLAISMTIVTYDTFKYNRQQYAAGYEDAEELTHHIVDGLEIKIVRLISETFLWLAQAQTLIRLFQRHREKMVIKWTAFVLISLEVIFAILNHFVHGSAPHQPRAWTNSIPALTYLFTLALNICYAAFVIVFSLRKRRFAFFHSDMQSMPLMALLSLLSVLIPVVFFILDLSKPDVSGWGSYVRWVGACAASVVVWEWVERIEALEREEKKGGILGREVFDGDEMLEYDASKPRSPRSGDGEKGGGHLASLFGNHLSARITKVGKSARQRRKVKTQDLALSKNSTSQSNDSAELAHIGTNHNLRRSSIIRDPMDPPADRPHSSLSRSDSFSGTSSVYAVRYHPPTDTTPPIPSDGLASKTPPFPDRLASKSPKILKYPSRLSRIPLPFRRQRQTPPAEVAAALAEQQHNLPPAGTPSPAPPPPTIFHRLHLRRNMQHPPMPKGVIYVPAPPRRRPSMNANTHDQRLDEVELESDHDDESEGGDERPPAVVRNAIRRSTTPANRETENRGQHHSDTTAAPAADGERPVIVYTTGRTPPIQEERDARTEQLTHRRPSPISTPVSPTDVRGHTVRTSTPPEDHLTAAPAYERQPAVASSAPPAQAFSEGAAASRGVVDTEGNGQPTNHDR